MTKEFNLSEKIGNRKKVETEFVDEHGDFVTIRDVIDVEDVKEFIRLLKERFGDWITEISDLDACYFIIDKLAGDKLK